MSKPRKTRKAVRLLPHKHTSGLFVRDGEYIADIKPDTGGRIIRKLGFEHDRALKLWDDLVSELSDDGDNPLLTTFLTGTFLPGQTHLKSYRYSASRVAAITSFLSDRYPDVRIADIRRHHADALRDYYPGASSRTCNGNLQKLKQALNYAMDMGLLDANPLARVKMLHLDNRRMVALSMVDFARIVDAAYSTDAHDLFLIMGLTGLRPSNVRLLTVRECVGDTIQIRPEKMKGSRWGIVPISEYVGSLLAARAVATDGDPEALLFPARGSGDVPKEARNIRRSWKTSMQRAGVTGVRVYDLRYFFASQLAKQGANEQQIGRLLCHAGHSVTSRYVHQDIEDLRHFVEEHGERVRAALGGETSILDDGAPAIRVWPHRWTSGSPARRRDNASGALGHSSGPMRGPWDLRRFNTSQTAKPDATTYSIGRHPCH